MKKILAFLLAFTLLFSFVACSGDNGNENNNNTPEAADDVQIRVGVMNGPTGMGIAKMINDNGTESDKYVFKTYSDPTDATASLTTLKEEDKNDLLCVPTNVAANLANKKEGFITVAAINCLGSLYVVAKDSLDIDSIEDLEGKTIYYGVKTSTTEPILAYILEQNGVEAEIIAEADHDVVTKKVKKGEIDIAVIPEPKATATINQAKAENQNYSIKLNLSEEWDKVSDTGLAMGCIIAKSDFVKNHKSALDSFLDEYKASIEYIGDKANKEQACNMIVSAGIVPQLPIAKSALENLYGAIVYIDGADMKSALSAFYKAIGITEPKVAFYYEK